MALEASMGLTAADVARFRDKAISEGRTYGIDWEGGRLSGMVDGLDAVRQYIYKTLKTEANRYLIYDMSMGTRMRDVVRSGNASREYLEADIPRMVREALRDERILGVSGFEFYWPEGDGDELTIRFRAETVYGTLEGVEMDV